jgi:hypothetical protein
MKPLSHPQCSPRASPGHARFGVCNKRDMTITNDMLSQTLAKSSSDGGETLLVPLTKHGCDSNKEKLRQATGLRQSLPR